MKASNKSRKKSVYISAVTCQNYCYEKPEKDAIIKKFKNELENLCSDDPLTLGRIKKEFKDISIISFRKSRHSKKDDDKIVLAVEKKKHKEKNNDEQQLEIKTTSNKKGKNDFDYYIKTGLYVGNIVYGGIYFSIKPDCNDILYKKMLRVANHIYIDKNESGASKDDNEGNFLLIQYLFLTSLQKISIMGLPQEYSLRRYHDLKIHGDLDVKNYILKDIPFKGQISSKKNERKYVQCIVDVLYTALNQCDTEIENNFKRLSFLKQELKANYSGRRPSLDTIQKAKKHRVLNNPMFSEYKRALEFAGIIIQNGSLLPSESEDSKTFGYLLDISSLWEVYLENILRRGLSDCDWTVSTQEKIDLYNGCFFKRSNFPDFVLRKKGEENNVAILDAKFKRMGFVNGDVDRADLHQIHSYAGYYRENGDTVVLCGLIYPLSMDLEKEKPKKGYVSNLYGINSDAEFVIDGVYKGKKIVENKSQNEESVRTYTDEDEESTSFYNEEVDVENYDVVAAETAFVNRIKKLLGESVEKTKMFD